MKLRFTHIAVVGALVAAFALAGCGRKGPLDPPPGAMAPQALPAATQSQPGLNPMAARPAGEAPAAPAAFDAGGRPVASSGVKRSLPMDWLIE